MGDISFRTMDIKCFVLLVIFNGDLIMGEKTESGNVDFIISLAEYFNARQIVLVEKEKGKKLLKHFLSALISLC